MKTRTEKDMLGERVIPDDALFGIHGLRAAENFVLAGRPVRAELVHACGLVKIACARANRELGYLAAEKAAAIERAATELAEGLLDRHVAVDALQGGAGTSTNMCVNEVIANRALEILGKCRGDYAVVHPLEHVNLHQSTNDTFATALKIAALRGLRDLAASLVCLLEAFQRKESEFAGLTKVGRTEMMDAALITLGREMGAYAEAFTRDRWRVYKCEERLRVVNLGGTAVGTGIGAPREYIFLATEKLREVTGLGLARAENLVDATQNADAFVETSGILKTCAANLVKIANDLRLLASGPDAGFAEIVLPPVQAGSSIMPGKINPVIPEAVVQAGLMANACDHALTQAAQSGSLELNPFMPLIAECLLSEIRLLDGAARTLAEKCVAGIAANPDRLRAQVANSTATLTALVGAIGYDAAAAIGADARRMKIGIREAALASGRITAAEFDALVSAESVSRLGSSTRKRKPE